MSRDGIAIALLSLTLLPAQLARAQNDVTISLCEEGEIIVAHPAEYIQEKVKRKGLSCLFLPHCCTPAWVLSPECYVLQWAKSRDPWQELKSTYTCSNYTLSPEEAFNRWLTTLANPGTAVGFSMITGTLDQVFTLYLTAANARASHLPSDVTRELLHLVDRQAVPFTANDVSNVKYLPSDDPQARKIFPGCMGSSCMSAITYQNLIVVDRRPYLTAPTTPTERCSRLSQWAHELTHVHQYNQMGFATFVAQYLSEGPKGHDNMTQEVEANGTEKKVWSECDSRRPYTPISNDNLVRFYGVTAETLSLATDLQSAVVSNDISVDAEGLIATVTPATRIRLAGRYGAEVMESLLADSRLPDLVIESIDATGSQVTVRVVNAGRAAAGAFDVSAKIRVVGPLAPREVSGILPVSGLAPGESKNLRFRMDQMANYSTALRSGTRRATASADTRQVVAESSESNNTLQRELGRPATVPSRP